MKIAVVFAVLAGGKPAGPPTPCIPPPLMAVTRTDLLELHEHVTDLAFRTMQAKNNDYASTKDALYNLRQCEMLGLCSVEAGILIRMTDKISRLTRYTQTGVVAVQSESIEDTVVDLVNYSVLLLAAINDKRAAHDETASSRQA